MRLGCPLDRVGSKSGRRYTVTELGASVKVRDSLSARTLKDHAWKLILETRADAHRSALTAVRPTTFPQNDVIRHVLPRAR